MRTFLDVVAIIVVLAIIGMIVTAIVSVAGGWAIAGAACVGLGVWALLRTIDCLIDRGWL
jgi:hypothetical protein